MLLDDRLNPKVTRYQENHNMTKAIKDAHPSLDHFDNLIRENLCAND